MVISVGGSKRGVGICFFFNVLTDDLDFYYNVHVDKTLLTWVLPTHMSATSYGPGSAVSILSVGCNSICTVYSVLSTKTAN